MADNEGGSEQDDVSFLRTDDMVCLQSTDIGTRICLAAEGFGNRHCFLENIADKNIPPEISSCVFMIEQALSVRALQEMITAKQQQLISQQQQPSSGSSVSQQATTAINSHTQIKHETSTGGGSRTLLYGHAVLLRHGHSKMYLACLSSTSSSSDKLAFDVGLQEQSQGEACWWTVHPASKQRSEGEKVRVGDEIILVSVATERYLHTSKENEHNIVDASFKLTHWSVAPFGTGSSRTKNVGFVFGGDVLRFYHGGDECLTVPINWNLDNNNLVIYEGGAVMTQARSLWRLDLVRTKWSGGFINWGYPLRIQHITTGRYLGINEQNEICLLGREEASVAKTAFCLRQNKDDKKMIIDEKDEEVIGSPLIKYGDTSFFLQHIDSGYWLSYKSYETKKRGLGRVEEKQAILSEEGKMDDGLEFSRSQEEEAKTARVIRKCEIMFNKFISILNFLQNKRGIARVNSQFGHTSSNTNLRQTKLTEADQEEMVMCLEDLIAYFSQPEEDTDHEEKQLCLKALRNRQDLFQEEGILNLILETIDQINAITTAGLVNQLLGTETSETWATISSYLYQLLASVIKGNHTNCAQFAQAHRLDWLFSRFSSQVAGEGTGMLDVLHCVLTDSPEALNMMKEDHIKVIISLLEKHGRDPKILHVLCSLCVGNGVAVRSSQNNICDNLLPSRSLLLQTSLVDHVASMRPNLFLGKVDKSVLYRKWYFELIIDDIEQASHLKPHFRVGWANTSGYIPYPCGGPKWGGNGVGDDLYSYGFDGKYLWTSGKFNKVRKCRNQEQNYNINYFDQFHNLPLNDNNQLETQIEEDEEDKLIGKGDVIGCILDLNICLITFTVNGIPVRGCFRNFNVDGMFFPVVSFSAKVSCRFLFGEGHGRLKFGPPAEHLPLTEALLPGQQLKVENCFELGNFQKGIIFGPSGNVMHEDSVFVPHPVDTSLVSLSNIVLQIRDKLAENIHEMWALGKIEAGWVYGEHIDSEKKIHPCLTHFNSLPTSEKKYDLNLALQTLKTIVALGYKITKDYVQNRIKVLRLPNEPYLQSNGYKPCPMDLSQIQLSPKMEELVEILAENTHNVWASERIKSNWSYSLNENAAERRSPHLVPYKYVDDSIKRANRNTASETVKILLIHSYSIDPPNSENSDIEKLLGRTAKLKYEYRSYRAEKTYASTSGKWYFEVEILTPGPVKVGWATLNWTANCEIGDDEHSWAFDCSKLRKHHFGTSEQFGKVVNVGDIVGCMLDLNDRTICFSLNGELLLDSSGGEMAFSDVNITGNSNPDLITTGECVGFVPAFTLGVDQKIRLIFGQDIDTLKCFTTCGLQEGYQPFCVNMNKNMTLWYSKNESLFVDIEHNIGDNTESSDIEVIRIPGGSDSSPALKIANKLFETQEKVACQFLRLSLPVVCHDYFIPEIEWKRRKFVLRSKKKDVNLLDNLAYPTSSSYNQSYNSQQKSQLFPHQFQQNTNLEQHMLRSGFSMTDIKGLQRTYSDEGTEDFMPPPLMSPDSQAIFNTKHPLQVDPSQMSAENKRGMMFNKTKSFDNTLTVPSMAEAQKLMKNTNKKVNSSENLENFGLSDLGTPNINFSSDGQMPFQTKKRSRSPFNKLFGKKEPITPLKSPRSGEETPFISIRNSSCQNLMQPGNVDNNLLRQAQASNTTVRRGSKVNITETLPDESNDMLDVNNLDLVDEYFYGVRIFPGQDPQHVYCGWVSSNFKYYDKDFNSDKIRKVSVQVWNESDIESDIFTRQNCYILNAGLLYKDVNENEQTTGRSNQGMFVGCHIDVSTGTLTFTANDTPTRYKFRCEPCSKLYPAVFFEATTSDVFQFELGRTPETLPLSAFMLKSTGKHLIPQFISRLKVQMLKSQHWVRCPNKSLKPHALKLSNLRGWSMLVDEPVSMLALHIPEENRCIDILELIEHDKLLNFHAKTLNLYGALCYQGNTRAAHMICGHVDVKQLMYAIKSEYMSGPLRTGFADLLIALHLEQFAYARSLTQNEFIISLDQNLYDLYDSDSNNSIANSISTLACASIRPKMKQSDRVDKIDSVKGLSSPVFPVKVLKQFIMEALNDAVKKSNRPMRDPIGGTNENLFVPLIKLVDKLLLIGCIDDCDLEWLLYLIDPTTFKNDFIMKNIGNMIDVSDIAGNTSSSKTGFKGLMQMQLDEGIKLQMSYLFNHLFDLQLRHRVESIVAFSFKYVKDLQNSQLSRYISVKQEDLPAALAAKKTKEFRCTPKEQMKMILDFKKLEEDFHDMNTEEIKQRLFDFHENLLSKIMINKKNSENKNEKIKNEASIESSNWKKIFILIKSKNNLDEKSLNEINSASIPEDIFYKKVVSTVISWTKEAEIENRELIRQIFSLLLRSYDGIGEVISSLEKTYIISETSKEDVQGLLKHLDIVRSLLPVQMSNEEEKIMRETLWTLVMNRVFFQHPDLIKILRVHENVMDIMTNTLSKRAQGQSGPSLSTNNSITNKTNEQQQQNEICNKTAIGDTSAMVVACCRFLCYFCRSSRLNQKAMFQHLDFLLENSNILLSRPSLRGSTPLDVASSSVMENPELALALRENYLEKIAVYLSKCGFQSNQDLLDKGYPDIGWDPVEGERYLDFFRTCVWVNGESVEENANLVIRLLIRRPECLGPALRGEGEGLLQAIKNAIFLSISIHQNQTAQMSNMNLINDNNSNASINQNGHFVSVQNYPCKDNEDYIDIGAAILNFYCCLVDLLGRCAPEANAIAEAKNDCIRARAILRSLVPISDLEGVLALRFNFQQYTNMQTEEESDIQPGVQPVHKQSIVLFFERVYGIETQEVFFRLLEDAFLPDLRAATILERADGSESQIGLALNRYIGNAILPLLIKNSYFFNNAEQWASVIDATLHTVYRLSKVKILTKGQREMVSDFLVALTHEMQPSMLLGLLRKLTVDVSVLTEYSTVALRLLTLHYERCGKYYSHSGQTNYGTASAEERKLTMLLFSNIFDSLSKMEYDPDLFGKALPCLTAIACALPPDYSLASNSKSNTIKIARYSDSAKYIPNPVNLDGTHLTKELNNFIQKFSEHYHDAYCQKKFELGWNYNDNFNQEKKLDPKLKPFHMLNMNEQNNYKLPISNLIKTMLALNWKLDFQSNTDNLAFQSKSGFRMEQRCNRIQDYNPNPVDMSSLTLSRELLSLVERISENTHELWAEKVYNSGGNLHPKMVPYDLLTDKEKKDNRELSLELLKYLQYEGYNVYKVDEIENMSTIGLNSGTTSDQQETRFASSLLSKLLQYLEATSLSLKLLKPSENFSRRNSFKKSSRDIKFFSKVILPLVERLFSAHRTFFLTSIQQPSGANTQSDNTSLDTKQASGQGDLKQINQQVQQVQQSQINSQISGSMATAKEKEMIAQLFCKLANLLRTRLSVMGSDAKISVRCLQVLINATDLRTIVRYSPDFIKTSMLTFFNHASDDLANCVLNLQQHKYTSIRGTTIKTFTSLNYIQLVLLPVLTSLFDHLASNDFGFDLLVNDIQVACYKILNSLYTLGTNPQLNCNRAFIKRELDFHRTAIGNCLGAFACTFPVAFLEPHLNKNNKNCIHSRSQEYSLEAQAVMSDLEALMPTLEDLMAQFDKYVESNTNYAKDPFTIDVILPMLCSYLFFWYQQGPENVSPSTSGNYVTMVTNTHLNQMLKSILNLVKNNINLINQPWMNTLAAHAGMIIINSNVNEALLEEPILPLIKRICHTIEKVFHREDIIKGYLKSQAEEITEIETQIQEEYSLVVRDVYGFLPLIIKYVDLQRYHWLKNNTVEAEYLYHCIASVFNIWSKSLYFKKEEQNFIMANEIDNMALIMPLLGKIGRPVITKSDRNASGHGHKVKKKKRDGKRDKDKEIASSLIVLALKKLLPVGLNLFAGREQELVQYAKDKILKKENETDIFDYIKTQLNLPEQIDPSDSMSWQHYLYSKLGSNNNSNSLNQDDKQLMLVSNKLMKSMKPEDKDKIQEKLVIRIIDMAKVLFGLHMIDHPSQKEKGVWRSCVSTQRKRAVIACFRMTSLHQLPRHRAMNIFLYSYRQIWLDQENIGQEKLIEDLTESFEEHEKCKGYTSEQEKDNTPDSLIQLVTTFSRSAITEHGSAINEDDLYMRYAHIFSESCGGPDEDEEECASTPVPNQESEGIGDQHQQQQLTEVQVEQDEGELAHEQELIKQKTLFQQLRLADRGLAEMILLYISACKGQQNLMVLRTLRLGISILRGGNTEVQHKMITHLKEKKDVGFFTSIAGLMNSCSVLDLDAFERNQKAEGLGVGSEGTTGEKNMHDAEFSCALFRFIQLLCEGHNLEFQNYLRTQAGNTTTVNVIIITVDYLLRLQESMMDFYWHYSSKQLIDLSGQENFTRAITVAKQVFSTLTESIQGPCQGNQQTLAHSRLWDAVGGFLFLFANMQDKLSKNSSQLNMLIELLDLQKEMVVMMLSMLEGNVVNGAIGRQMVDTFVESASNLELILKFFDMFLKLKGLISSSSFQEMDKKNLGWITAVDFKKAMEQQKVYTKEEIQYLMDCCEPNHDGLIDYIEFTDRFHNPAKEIGFNLAVLLTNLSEHMPGDVRLARFLEIAASVLNYFEPFLGRIEIMGSAKRVERVYFEIQESSINQWEKPQIKESKRAFLYSVVNEDGDKEKLELFVNFCEDAIFEMKHAASISMEDEEDSNRKAAKYPFINEEESKFSFADPFIKLGLYLSMQILRCFSYLTPANLKKQILSMKEKTLFELIIGCFKLIFNMFFFSNYFVYSIVKNFCRILFRLMSGEALSSSQAKINASIEANETSLAITSPYISRSATSNGTTNLEHVSNLKLNSQVDLSTSHETKTEEMKNLIERKNRHTINGELQKSTFDIRNESKTMSKNNQLNVEENLKEANKQFGSSTVSYIEDSISPESKIEQSAPVIKSFSIDISGYTHRFICFLARNFYTFKNIALFIAFSINFILLFYKISNTSNSNINSNLDLFKVNDSNELLNSGEGSTNSFILDDSNESSSSSEDTSEEYVSIQDNLYYLSPILRVLAIIHSIISLCLLFGYYHLKLPLAIFKREKEISRAMEFEGLYITEQNKEYLQGQWDKIVISTSSFPVNYWDKFVKKRVRERYSDQFDYDSITKLLGMTNDSFNNNMNSVESQTFWRKILCLKYIDFKYQVWKAGVTITDHDFIYNLFYLAFSLLGNINYFFFAAHLLDIAFVIKSLNTILKSVTHNGRLLVLTVILLVIVVYIYTVFAFNFFRKFYVQSGDDEGDNNEGEIKEEINDLEDFQSKKCHSMYTCFIFNLYQGVRAGGGIGDVIEPPDGDAKEYFRIIFDISFFFFVIVILLAILQGLIIDAFGELRDQLQAVSDNMESNCFICGIGKDYFDKIPHGFETHVKKEHDFANYLFFLMHLINKPDTDYTGQETYVWELYQKRCWDFFPVGECFRKQNEEELAGVN